jgi:4-diphosphocytidyl-2-C-methyl-D-erythritol kinase
MAAARTRVEAAPAKINLGLEVLGRRDDGFHRLETVFQTLELADLVEVDLRPGTDGISLACSDGSLPADPRNLAWRAAAAVLRACPGLGQVAIRLGKLLPHGAGLGGGSSDAAAVLRALAGLDPRVAALPLPALALELGSDVPFFLIGGTAHALGRGEVLTPLADASDIPVTIVMPAAGLATPGVFAALTDGERGPREPRGAEWWRQRLAGDAAGRPPPENRLEAPARRLSAALDGLLLRLRAAGLATLLCGSGSACAVLGGWREPPLPPGTILYHTRLRPRARLGAWPARTPG